MARGAWKGHIPPQTGGIHPLSCLGGYTELTLVECFLHSICCCCFTLPTRKTPKTPLPPRLGITKKKAPTGGSAERDPASREHPSVTPQAHTVFEVHRHLRLGRRLLLLEAGLEETYCRFRMVPPYQAWTRLEDDVPLQT